MCAVLQLPATNFGIGRNHVCVITLGAHETERLFADLHRNIIFFGFVSIRSGKPTTFSITLAHIQTGNQRHHVKRRSAHAMGACLARNVVRQDHFQFAKISIQLVLLVQIAQPLRHVPQRLLETMRLIVFEVEHLGRLFAQNQDATDARANNRIPFIGIRQKFYQITAVQFFGGGKFAIVQHRQAATILRWHDHLKTKMFEHCDRGLTNFGFVIISRTAVKVHDLVVRFQTRRAAKPGGETAARAPMWNRRVARDA